MEDKAFINPEFPENGMRLPSTCILVANKTDLAKLRSNAGLDKSFAMLSCRVFYGGNSGFCVAGPFIGAPYAAIIFENLAVRGCERFVFWGWCGSLSENLCAGDIVIPGKAFADDGTSRHYLSAGQKSADASAPVAGSLRDNCEHAGLRFVSGPMWTMDAIYRETPEMTGRARKNGAVCVDMETAALFSVSAFRGKYTAAILVVSDELSDTAWKPGFASRRFKAARARVAEITAVFASVN